MNKDQRYQEWADLNGVNHPDAEVREGFKQIKAEDAFKRGYDVGIADYKARMEAAFQVEIKRVSQLEYNSNLICRHFWTMIKNRMWDGTV